MTDNQNPVAPGRKSGQSPPGDILRQIADTREMRTLVATLMPELLRVWAESGTGPVRTGARKMVAGIAGGDIQNAMLDKTAMGRAPHIHDLAADDRFMETLSARLGAATDAFLSVAVDTARTIESLDTDRKKEMVRHLIGHMSTGKSAELLTICLRTANDTHKNDPEFLSRVIAPAFEKWVRAMDFGELKEFFESSAPDITALIRMANQTLWNYPGKVISLVALAPSIANIAVDALAETLGAFNDNGTPDMVADVILSMLREIDARAVGRLVNAMAEQARQFHVGSALIGESGAPQMPNDLSALLDAIAKQTDGALLWKARTALAELKGQAHAAMTDVLAANPDLLAGGMASQSGVHNARIRAASRRASVLESMDPEVINNALGTSLANLDLQEGANIVNAAALLAGRLLEDRPAEIRDKAAALVDALDLYGVSEVIEKAGEVVGEALLPLARALVPPLARGILKSLAGGDDEFEDGARAARNLLAALLKDREAD
ncbi:MAG: hypothetical protein ACOZBW_11580 [Thermodesulfobacteriota bacterium]